MCIKKTTENNTIKKVAFGLFLIILLFPYSNVFADYSLVHFSASNDYNTNDNQTYLYDHELLKTHFNITATRLDIALNTYTPQPVTFVCDSNVAYNSTITPTDSGDSVTLPSSGGTYNWYSFDVSTLSLLCTNYNLGVLTSVRTFVSQDNIYWNSQIFRTGGSIAYGYRVYTGTPPTPPAPPAPPQPVLYDDFVTYRIASTTCTSTATTSNCSYLYATSTPLVDMSPVKRLTDVMTFSFGFLLFSFAITLWYTLINRKSRI